MGERTTHYYGDDCNPPHEPTSLTDRLLAALDLEQQIAEAATPGEWHGSTVESVAGGTIYDATVAIASVEYDLLPWRSRVRRFRSVAEADGNSAHIAHQHPARTLRRITALRRIVERHKSRTADSLDGCDWCSTSEFPVTFPCPDLLDFAAALGVEP